MKYDGYKVIMSNDLRIEDEYIDFSNFSRLLSKFDKEPEVKPLYIKICECNELKEILKWNELNSKDLDVGKTT